MSASTATYFSCNCFKTIYWSRLFFITNYRLTRSRKEAFFVIIFLNNPTSRIRLHNFSEFAPPKHAFYACRSTKLLINMRFVRMSFSLSTRLTFFVQEYSFNVCSRFSPYAIYVISFYFSLFVCLTFSLLIKDPAPLVTAFVEALLMLILHFFFGLADFPWLESHEAL